VSGPLRRHHYRYGVVGDPSYDGDYDHAQAFDSHWSEHSAEDVLLEAAELHAQDGWAAGDAYVFELWVEGGRRLGLYSVRRELRPVYRVTQTT
jgi:hypothetical protein